MKWQILAIMFILAFVAGLWFLSVTSRPQLVILQEADWQPTHSWIPGRPEPPIMDISGSRSAVWKSPAWWRDLVRGKPTYPAGIPGMDTTPYWNRIEGRMMGIDEVRSIEEF
jgi:hypothetical protein